MSGIAGIIHFRGPAPDPDAALQLSHGVGHRGTDDKGRHFAGPAALCHRAHRARPDEVAQPHHSGVRVFLMDGRCPGGLEALATDWATGGAEAAAARGGSWALAVWDPARAQLDLLRSAEGARPLFWSRRGDQLAFCSELPPLLRLPWVSRQPAMDHVAEYLSFRYVHAPRTLLRDVFAVPSAHLVRHDLRGPETSRFVTPRWFAPGDRRPSPAEAVERVDAAIGAAVDRVSADPSPAAVLLSGGLDSSAIVWHLHRLGRRPPTFTVAMDDDPVDESSIASRVAKVLETEHHVIRLSPRQIVDAIGPCTRLMGAPLPTAAAVLQHLLFAAIKNSAKIVLSGDGGDEVLAGRTMGFLASRQRGAKALALLPGPLRAAVRKGLDRLGLRDLGASAAHFGRDRTIGGSRVFHSAERVDVLRDPGLVRPGIRRTVLEPLYQEVVADPINEILHVWQRGWLPEDSLARSDRMGSTLGLELRFPMLDDAVRAATCALPGDLKVRPRGLGFDTKWPLREAMRARLPAQLVDRPKRSLPSPLDGFLRVGLGRDWMQGALSAMRADASGLFAPAALQRLEAAHLSGQANHGLKLWTLLLFHEWWSQLHEP